MDLIASPFALNHNHDDGAYVPVKKLVNDPRAAKTETILHELDKKHRLKGIEEEHGRGALSNAIHVVEHGPAGMFKFRKKISVEESFRIMQQRIAGSRH